MNVVANNLKSIAETKAFRAQMEDAFFEAMHIGYASEDKQKKTSIPELPGSKLVLPYVAGPWRVADTYLVTPAGPRSGGMTVIWYEGVPVWMMQYLGQYDERAVPCLKAALRAAYSRKEFFGGRGPDEFTFGVYRYQNDIDKRWRTDFQGSNFFQGYEWVEMPGRSGQKLGWHSYQGMMLV